MNEQEQGKKSEELVSSVEMLAAMVDIMQQDENPPPVLHAIKQVMKAFQRLETYLQYMEASQGKVPSYLTREGVVKTPATYEEFGSLLLDDVIEPLKKGSIYVREETTNTGD